MADSINLQALLDEIARDGGDLPALLADPERDADLAALETEALAAFDDIRSGDNPTDEDVAALETLANVVEQLRGEQGRRQEVAEAQRARVADLAARVARPAAEGEQETEEGDGEQPAEGEQPETTPEPEQPAEGQPTEQPATQPEAQPEQEPEPVTASARRRVDLSRIARRNTRPTAPAPSAPSLADTIVAAADVPGVPGGAGFPDWTAVAEAAQRRFGSMGSPRNAYLRQGVAVIKKNMPAELTAFGQDDQAVLDLAANESRLPNGSLVAAGGWCSPSETLYDLLELESTEGLFSLPQINAARGGIRFTKGPHFGEIYTAPGFWTQTEAQVEAATQKPVYEIPCPDWEEVRMDVEGYSYSAGILTSRTYPEIIARFLRGAVVAHAHRMSKLLVDRVVAQSTDVGTLNAAGANASATSGVLAAIELQAQSIRSRERMARGSSIELVGPDWLMAVLRVDYANRNAIANPYDVTDAQIIGWMRQRGVNPQFLTDWQPIDGWDGTTGIPGAPVTAWPATAQLLMYPAGTFVELTQDVISLDAIYDSTNIRTNRYTAVFVEDGLGVAKRGYESRVFTVPTAPNGHSAEQVDVLTAPV